MSIFKDVEKSGGLYFFKNDKEEFPSDFKNLEGVTITSLIKYIEDHTTKELNLPFDSHIPEDILD